MTNNIIDVTPKKKGCTKCSAQDKIKQLPIWSIVFSIYFLIASVYGTIQIVKDVISLF
jgi:hypothetical protein